MPKHLTIDEAFGPGGPLAGPRGGGPGVELLDGLLVRRDLPSAAVVATVVRLASELDRAAHGLEVDVRGAIACPPYDLLRPEVSVRRPVPPHLRRPAPGPAAVVLAVLIGDDERETAWRAQRCAAAQLAEVWTIAPEQGHGVRMWAPRGGVYTERELLLRGERVAPSAAPWLQVVTVPIPSARSASAPPGQRVA